MSNKIIIFSVVLSITILCAGVVYAICAGAAGRSPGPAGPLDLGHVPGELLVRFEPKANGIQRSRAEKTQILSSLGAATIREDFRIVPGLSHIKLPAGVTVEQAIEQLNKTPYVIFASVPSAYRQPRLVVYGLLLPAERPALQIRNRLLDGRCIFGFKVSRETVEPQLYVRINKTENLLLSCNEGILIGANESFSIKV